MSAASQPARRRPSSSAAFASPLPASPPLYSGPLPSLSQPSPPLRLTLSSACSLTPSLHNAYYTKSLFTVFVHYLVPQLASPPGGGGGRRQGLKWGPYFKSTLIIEKPSWMPSPLGGGGNESLLDCIRDSIRVSLS